MKWILLGCVIVILQTPSNGLALNAMGSLLKTAPVALKALHEMVHRASAGDKYWLSKEWVQSSFGIDCFLWVSNVSNLSSTPAFIDCCGSRGDSFNGAGKLPWRHGKANCVVHCSASHPLDNSNTSFQCLESEEGSWPAGQYHHEVTLGIKDQCRIGSNLSDEALLGRRRYQEWK